VRLFVAVEVPDRVRRTVAGIERPPGEDVRWADPSSWHVTLRFLGEVDGSDGAEAALAAVRCDPATAVVGRTPKRLGPTAVVLPVEGLAGLAEAVSAAFAGLPGEERRRFAGHLTLGRLRRQGRWPAAGVGVLAAEMSWMVEEVVLVRSHLGGGRPARYEVLARHRLHGA
jgi:2'-5' RNA ligase